MRARFRGDLHAPAGARSFVAKHLAKATGSRAKPREDDVLLIVSELVTNSVRAGAEVIEVHVHSDAQQIEVRVADDAPGWPTPRSAELDDLDGRGLAIVNELADRWTASPGNPGKSVTATWFRG